MSGFLQANLARIVEEVKPEDIASTIESTVEIGGYFKRWRGGALKRWTDWSHDKAQVGHDSLTVDERLTLAFLKVSNPRILRMRRLADTGTRQAVSDQNLRRLRAELTPGGPGDQGYGRERGATLRFHSERGAAAIVRHARAAPLGCGASMADGRPHWVSSDLSVLQTDSSDTRVLLCNAVNGQVTALTDRHHAEARTEAARLRRLGTADGAGMITDSFGESRWMGAIENTRGFGDFEWKPMGVTAEPEITYKLISGKEHAYLVLVTDGLTNMMSDQEIVDLARQASDPTRAAKNIVHFGEDLGAQDNCTCIVVPLAGWGNVGGEDTTEPRREYRRRQARMYNGRMQRQ